jgi:hypothetical protein
MKKKIEELKEIAKQVGELLQQTGNSSQAKLMFYIAEVAPEKKIFSTMVGSAEIWGGAGSVFDLVIDDQKTGIEKGANKMFLELLLSFAECICDLDASNERVRSSLSILKHWKKSGIF